MSANDDLLDLLKEALDRGGTVTGKRMFGGVGVYFDGTFFAIIDDGVVYLKTSDKTRASFEVERSRPFSYQTKSGETHLTSYWRLPDRLLDDPDGLREWAQAAVAAAREAAAKKQRKPATKSKAKPMKKSRVR
jgi:DNA transformation protein and related proteins